MNSLRSLFRLSITLVAIAAALLWVAVWQVGRANQDVVAAHQTRYLSALLADELRQSSDDLTRLARTFVVSGDPKWEQQYFEILDIRNGKAPRPPHYEKIYWDFRAVGDTPARAGAPTRESLLDRMKQAGFTEAEFGKLKEAAGNSDDLVRTETIAMNMVKGLYADDKGGFTAKGAPDRAKAAEMMHDLQYHRFKAKIMKPLDEFFVMLDERTLAVVTAAEASRSNWYAVMATMGFALALVAIAALAYAGRWTLGRLGAEPKDVVEAVGAVARGDLVQARLSGSLARGSVMAALADMSARLSDAVVAVRSGADSVAMSSKEIADGNADLSQRTEEQAAALQQTAASMEELGATVRRNAENSRDADRLAVEASDVAGRAGDAVERVVQVMQGIDESSRRISEIITVIDGIAFQTNILALNAAVEAARAGEQGRGFAVVASEVRTLAARSADAAKEIKQLIGDSVERVERGSALVGEAGTTMVEVVGSIRKVSEIVREISVASLEQSSGVDQVGEAVSQMDKAVQQNTALVEQSAASTEDLARQSQQLVQAVSVFRVTTTAAPTPV
ncbi:MAG: methyl-accepting chemotaxis protein [Burkholderiales bacterium]|jgi:methyl-accepting chemotaxis protein|nr:methyl-accepting chemotaxis protein [Burkholderiales bacterium]